MALPSTGQLSFSQIYAEVYGSHSTQQCSMFTMASAASGIPTTNIGVDDWYGYSQAINVYYGAVTYISNAITSIDAYRSIIRDGQTSSQTMSVTIAYSGYATGDADGTFWWSRNSTSSWTYVTSFYSSSVNFNFTVTNISYTDVIRVRMDMQCFGSGSADGTFSISAASVTSGGGSTNIITPFNWSEYVYL